MKLTPRDWTLVFGPAVLCRGVLAISCAGQPVFQKYLFLAQHLSDFLNRPFYSSPVYTVWMFLLTQWMKLSSDGIRVIQYVFGMIALYCLVEIVRLLRNKKEAVVSGIIFGLASPFITYESDLVTASMVIAIQAIALLSVIKLITRSSCSLPAWLFTGAFIGASTGIRPNAILTVPAICLVILVLRHKFEKPFMVILFLLTGIAIAVSPITITNYFKTNELIPVTASGGSVFYSSNNFRATGLGYSPPPALTEIEHQWMQRNLTTRPVEHDIFKFLAERAAGKQLTHQETSQFYSHEAWQFLLRSPGKSIVFWMKKLFYAFNNYDVLDTASLIATSQVVKQTLPFLVPGGIIVVLGLFGMYQINYRNPGLWVVISFLIPHLVTAVVFYVNGRLRVPLLFFLCIFTGTALCHLVNIIRTRDSSIWLSVLFIMGLATVTGYKDAGIHRHSEIESPAFYASVKGLAAMKAGSDTAAIDLFLEAVDKNPLGAREAWSNLAKLYVKQGDQLKSQRCHQRSIGIWSLEELKLFRESTQLNEYELMMTEAQAYWRSGKHTEATMMFLKLTKEYPEYPDPWFNAAISVTGSETQWKNISRFCERALQRGMKLSLESVRAHELLIRAYEHTDNHAAVQKARKQLSWEKSRVFNL